MNSDSPDEFADFLRDFSITSVSLDQSMLVAPGGSRGGAWLRVGPIKGEPRYVCGAHDHGAPGRSC
jgi:hypothetical protein